jgi:hypothetical protein
MHACAADVAGIQACVTNAIKKNASGVNSTSYEFAGVCPTEVRLELNSGTPTGASTATSRTPCSTSAGPASATAWTWPTDS